MIFSVRCGPATVAASESAEVTSLGVFPWEGAEERWPGARRIAWLTIAVWPARDRDGDSCLHFCCYKFRRRLEYLENWMYIDDRPISCIAEVGLLLLRKKALSLRNWKPSWKSNAHHGPPSWALLSPEAVRGNIAHKFSSLLLPMGSSPKPLGLGLFLLWNLRNCS